jgi:hypothetical protein
MKFKALFIIVILAIVTLPSINAQFQSLELNIKDETNRPNAGFYFFPVWFAFGEITNLDIWEKGYGNFYYTFDAVNLICILSTEDHPIPFIHRFHDGETFGIPYPKGIITEQFILAF